MRTSEDFFAEIERLHSLPGIKGWIARFRAGHWQYYLKLPIEWPKDRYYDLIAFWQRGKRGWADRDVWSMDIYLARVIPAMLRNMAETTYGCPDDDVGLAEVHSIDVEGGSDEMKKWKAYLREVASVFDAYVNIKDAEDAYVLSAYDPILEKLRHLFDHYPSLWT